MSASDAIEFIIAGATAIATGTVNFIEPDCAEKIVQGIKEYCIRKNIANVKDLIGSVE
jgi:dihydroorotate dehydrogenase (NAD+) catalytic subunit